MRLVRRSVLAAVLAIAACKRSEPAPKSGRTAPASPVPGAPFSIRDLAFATALDARLARFSLVAFDVEAALRAPAATRMRAATADAAMKVRRLIEPRAVKFIARDPAPRGRGRAPVRRARG
jgi:hypothetical protein